MTYTPRQIDLVEQAMLTLGESAPDTVDQILALPKMKLLTGALKAYEGPSGERIFRATASSTIEDLHGDLMTEDCVRDMAMQAKRGPIGKGLTIFLNHRYSVPEDVAGKVANTQVLTRENGDDGLPIWDMDYEILLRREGRGSERADSTWSLIKDDEITLGISIGAYILEYDYRDKEAGFWGGLIINKVLLVETSIVGIPANQRSWVQNAVIAIGKSLGIEEKQIRRVLDGKEAAPMAVKSVGVNGDAGSTDSITVNAAGEVIAEATLVVAGEDTEDPVPMPDNQEGGTPVNSPEEQTAEPKVTDGDADTDTTSEEAEKAATPEVNAEAAPDQESTAEHQTDETQENDGETTEASAPALSPEASDLVLEASASGALPFELLTTALERAAAELSTTRQRNKELEEENTLLKAKVTEADKDIKDAAEIVELIARSPLGRKTQFRQPVESFVSRYGAIYDEGYLKLFDSEQE